MLRLCLCHVLLLVLSCFVFSDQPVVHVTCLCLQLIDIDGAALLEQRKALQQAHGVDVLVYAADVCSNSAVERAVREHAARWGGRGYWFGWDLGWFRVSRHH
jgi:hypothetical protein